MKILNDNTLKLPPLPKNSLMIPFNKSNGDMLTYPESHIEIKWKENFVFEDTLLLSNVSRGTSAANFIFVSKTNNVKYTMFLTDLFDIMIKYGILIGGEISGKFTFVKRGRNFGVKKIE